MSDEDGVYAPISSIRAIIITILLIIIISAVLYYLFTGPLLLRIG
jgi:hypothetical protein